MHINFFYFDISVRLDNNSTIHPIIDLDVNNFSAMFRHSAPYIAMHRGTIMVIHIAGFVLKQKDNFAAIMDDISILKLLGIKLVLVHALIKVVANPFELIYYREKKYIFTL